MFFILSYLSAQIEMKALETFGPPVVCILFASTTIDSSLLEEESGKVAGSQSGNRTELAGSCGPGEL